MTDIPNILSKISHRPFELPVGEWRYYQEWNNALFLHWVVPFNILREHVPENLQLDGFAGKYYVSLVAFTMQKIRPHYLPSLKFVSDFDEINLRTYVESGNRKGVYFLSIEAGKHLSAFVAKQLSGLNYEKSVIVRSGKQYKSENAAKRFFLDAEFEVEEKLLDKSILDKWLTERYCLYLQVKGETFRYDIHHKEWELRNVTIGNLQLEYRIGEYTLSSKHPDLFHYSDGVKVLAWGREKV
ncbi:MAG: DUF2071 domain-containing protein [Sphingobacteriales bacterium]|nr:MAG: DUF2071 domain-containing protein [Sphingobacteriales bacterium]